MGLSSLFQKKNNYFDKKITPQCGYCQFANRTKAENSVLCTKTGTFWDEKNSCPKFVYSPLKRVPVKQLKNEGIVSDEEIYVEVKDEEPEAKPAKETKPAEESKPVEEAKPAQETAPAPEAKPVEEAQPAQEAAAPVEEAKPAEEAKAEQAPAEETKPVEIDPLDAAISSALADAAAFAQQNIPPKSE
jgi:hypothetical protein